MCTQEILLLDFEGLFAADDVRDDHYFEESHTTPLEPFLIYIRNF
jgi:hypothetical protein